MFFFFLHIEGYDFRTLRRFFEVFPSHPLTRLVQGYFQYTGIPISLVDADDDKLSENSDNPDLPKEDADNDPFSAILVRVVS